MLEDVQSPLIMHHGRLLFNKVTWFCSHGTLIMALFVFFRFGVKCSDSSSATCASEAAVQTLCMAIWAYVSGLA